jgi:peroxiredoxin
MLRKVVFYFNSQDTRPCMVQKRKFSKQFFKNLGFTIIELSFEQALGVLVFQAGKTTIEDQK